jgi:20S proteasome alpha/beta subunit
LLDASTYRIDAVPQCRTDTTVLATGGFRGDISTLQKLLRAKLVEYEHKHGEAMKVRDV